MRHSNLFRTLSFAALSLAVVACGGNKEQEQTVAEKTKVNVQQVFEREIDLLGNFTAIVEANDTNNISPKMSITIATVYVHVVYNVRTGQVLGLHVCLV